MMPPIPVQITFRHMEPSPAVETRILEEASDLDRYFDRITRPEQIIPALRRAMRALRGGLAASAPDACAQAAEHLPLERLYRDSRCGSLMLPWTAELVLDRMGRETLYESGEKDE